MARRFGQSFIILPVLLSLSSYTGAQTLLVTDANGTGGVIRRFSLTGQDLGNFADHGTRGGFWGPGGIALDSKGDVYVASSSQNAIYWYAPTGTLLGTFASTGMNNPRGLAFDKNGNLYVANFSDGTIHRYSPTGVDLGVFASTGEVARGLAFDSKGDLYVSVYGTTDAIDIFSSAGTYLGAWGSPADLDAPFGITFDTHGDLFVANQANGTVREFSSAGVDLGNFVSGLGGINSVSGAAFDATGNLYVATDQSKTIEKFSATGANLGTFYNGLVDPKFLVIVPAAVPEPGALTMLAGMLFVGGGLLLRRRRK